MAGPWQTMLKHLQDFALGLKSLRQSKEISEENIRLKEEELDNLLNQFKETAAEDKRRYDLEFDARMENLAAQTGMLRRSPSTGSLVSIDRKRKDQALIDFDRMATRGPYELISYILRGDYEKYKEAESFFSGMPVGGMTEELFNHLSSADIDETELRNWVTHNLALNLLERYNLTRDDVSSRFFPDYKAELFVVPGLEDVVKTDQIKTYTGDVMPDLLPQAGAGGQQVDYSKMSGRNVQALAMSGGGQTAQQELEQIAQVQPQGGHTEALNALTPKQGAGQAPPGELVEVNGSIYTVTKDNKVYLNDGTLVERRELVDMVLKKYMAEQKKKLEPPKPQVLSGGRGQLQGQYMQH